MKRLSLAWISFVALLALGLPILAEGKQLHSFFKACDYCDCEHSEPVDVSIPAGGHLFVKLHVKYWAATNLAGYPMWIQYNRHQKNGWEGWNSDVPYSGLKGVRSKMFPENPKNGDEVWWEVEYVATEPVDLQVMILSENWHDGSGACHQTTSEHWLTIETGGAVSGGNSVKTGGAKSVGKPVSVSTMNIAGVQNGPTQDKVVVIRQTSRVDYIMNYHWNNAQGAPPGLIALRSQDGKVYGPWQTKGLPGQGGVPNAFWECRPGVVIPPGSYTVLDSDPSTWASNEQSGWVGMGDIKYVSFQGKSPLSKKLEKPENGNKTSQSENEIDRTTVPLGSVWNEEENGWKGTWTRREDTNQFDALWTKPGEGECKAVLTITIKGHSVSIDRATGSCNNNPNRGCTYSGTIADDGVTVNGSGGGSGGCGNWKATIGAGMSNQQEAPSVDGQQEAPSVDGEWQSDWGPVVLDQASPDREGIIQVTGYWIQGPNKRGKFTRGTYNPSTGVVSLHYYEAWASLEGDVTFHLSPDGKTLSGRWSQPDGTGSWTLTR